MKQLFPGVYRHNGRLFTVNLTPGKRVYNERLMTVDGVEYRSWNPYRSKMAAAILKGLKKFPVKEHSRILYLGVSSGTTASHFSDIATRGFIYGVDVAFRPMKRFVALCGERHNMTPIMADAGRPEKYRPMVDAVDLIYQDISQKSQVAIFLKNMEVFEAPEGIIMIKARSIDVALPPKKVFDTVKKEIGKHYTIEDERRLDPQAKDHICLAVKR